MDRRLSRHEFLDHLAAGPTGHAQPIWTVSGGVQAAHGQLLWLQPLGNSAEQGDAFGADAQPVAGIFDIASLDDLAVGTEQGSPDPELRVGSMGFPCCASKAALIIL